jgi:hypothetical protein
MLGKQTARVGGEWNWQGLVQWRARFCYHGIYWLESIAEEEEVAYFTVTYCICLENLQKTKKNFI